MAFYRSSNNVWRPPTIVGSQEQILKNSNVSILSPHSGYFLIIGSKKINNFAIETAITKKYFTFSNSNFVGTSSSGCSICLRKIEGSNVNICSGIDQTTASNTAQYPSCMVYDLGANEPTIDFLGYVSTSQNSANIKSKPGTWVNNKLEKYENTGAGFYIFPGSSVSTSIVEPQREMIMVILGGRGINSKYSSKSGLQQYGTDGSVSIEVDNSIRYYANENRNVDGLIVMFYKFMDPVDDLKIKMACGKVDDDNGSTGIALKIAY